MKYEVALFDDPFFTVGKKLYVKIETFKGFGLWVRLKRWNDSFYSTCYNKIELHDETRDSFALLYRTCHHTAEFEIGLAFFRFTITINKVDVSSEPCTPFDGED